jgi:hypothetical protein
MEIEDEVARDLSEKEVVFAKLLLGLTHATNLALAVAHSRDMISLMEQYTIVRCDSCILLSGLKHFEHHSSWRIYCLYEFIMLLSQSGWCLYLATFLVIAIFTQLH